MALKNPDQLFMAGLGSTEGFVSTIIHMTVLLPVSTWADGSPDHPFQKMQLSQLEFYKLVFYKKLPKGNVKRDIDLSSQTQCSNEMLAPKHRPVNPSVTRDIPWHEEHSGKRVGSHLKSVTKLHIA